MCAICENEIVAVSISAKFYHLDLRKKTRQMTENQQKPSLVKTRKVVKTHDGTELAPYTGQI